MPVYHKVRRDKTREKKEKITAVWTSMIISTR
jgi:hypothetical protein